MVDPEALLLVSLALRDRERRLHEVVAWWSQVGATLMSVQRAKNLARGYPATVQKRLGEWADWAIRGGDHRWNSVPRSKAVPLPRSKAQPGSARVLEPAALTLRLRLGIGVGIKSDVLSFLLASQGRWASIRRITDATAYTPRAAKRACDEMAAARLVDASHAPPAEYRAQPESWMPLLGIDSAVPPWRYWNALYRLVADVFAWQASTVRQSPYVAASGARDRIEAHRDAFRLNQIAVRDESRVTGADYMSVFELMLGDLAEWVVQNA